MPLSSSFLHVPAQFLIDSPQFFVRSCQEISLSKLNTDLCKHIQLLPAFDTLCDQQHATVCGKLHQSLDHGKLCRFLIKISHQPDIQLNIFGHQRTDSVKPRISRTYIINGNVISLLPIMLYCCLDLLLIFCLLTLCNFKNDTFTFDPIAFQILTGKTCLKFFIPQNLRIYINKESCFLPIKVFLLFCNFPKGCSAADLFKLPYFFFPLRASEHFFNIIKQPRTAHPA